MGGDEFFVILENVSNKEYSECINCLESMINKFNKDHDYTLQLAYGYAKANHEETYEELSKRADKLMYENKMRLKK